MSTISAAKGIVEGMVFTAEAVKSNPFPESKVQQLVYHGTGQKFRAFKRSQHIQGVIWFTSSLDKIRNKETGAVGHGYVVSAYVNIKNPADWKKYDKLGLYEYGREGLDGAVLPNDTGFDCFVLHQSQIKIVSVDKI